MNRREFLRCAVFGGASAVAGNLGGCAPRPKVTVEQESMLKGMRPIDAHAHPDWIKYSPQSKDGSSTLEAIKAIGMSASSFSAVGDHVFLSRNLRGSEYQNTLTTLEWYRSGAKSGEVRIVLKAEDIPQTTGPGRPPGAILAIEGGDPLEGKAERVNEFYRLGVRMITVVHYRNNELGDVMRGYGNLNPGPSNHGLTAAGRKVVERMQELGMVVDVAHAHPDTLKMIAAMSGKPIVDSHTSPCPREDSAQCGRFRTWKDMELVAKTGGVVCTWPLRHQWDMGRRETFLDWAKEIMEMKKRLGIDHVGLGTDGGGGLPRFIEGYRDLRDLTYLMAAMQEVGLARDEIAAYMGGNFYRVLRQCIG